MYLATAFSAIRLRYHIHSCSSCHVRSSRSECRVCAERPDSRPSSIGRIQPVTATPSVVFCSGKWSSAFAGVRPPRVLRGLVFRACAAALSSWAPCWLGSVPSGKYRRSKPLVFSLLPRCRGLPGVAEVDLQARVDREVCMLRHLGALIPCQGAAQVRRWIHDGPGNCIADGVCSMTGQGWAVPD